MDKKLALVTMLLPLSIGITSCTSSKKLNDNINMSENNINDEENITLTNSQNEYITRCNDFAFKFFKKSSGFDSKITSPLSASYLMGILANGANGDTRKEILNTLEANQLGINDINTVYKKLMERQAENDSTTIIDIANYIAMNRQYEAKEDFASTVKSYYKATIESLDFSSPKAANHINTWCKEETKGMIPKIIDETNASDISYILNAIYFNGTWQSKFDPKQTKKERFQGYTRDIKRADMMHQEDNFMYATEDDFSAVILPYGNGTFTMTVLLPHEGKSIHDVLQGINGKSFTQLLEKADDCIVDLKIPRFTTETSMTLNEIISQLGAPSIFSAEADFSHFANANVHISKMLQKAKIEVNETGTKAAAVTEAFVALSALQPNEPRHVNFHANRPFVYIISNQVTGVISFIGQFTGNEL